MGNKVFGALIGFLGFFILLSQPTQASEKEIIQTLLAAQQSYQAGQYEEALGQAQSGFNAALQELGPQADLTLQAELSFAEMLVNLGNPDPALSLLQDLNQKLAPQAVERPDEYGQTIFLLAQIHGVAGRYELAERLLSEYTTKVAAPSLAAMSLQSQMLLAQGKHKEAEEALQAALKRHQDKLEDPEYLLARERLGQVYTAMGKYELAIKTYLPLVDDEKRILGDQVVTPWITLAELGEAHRKAGDLSAAESELDQALGQIRALTSEADPTYWQFVPYRAQLLQDLGRYPESKELFTQILSVNGQLYGETSPQYLIDLNNLAGVERLMGDWNDSRQHYQEALKLAEGLWGRENPEVLAIINNLALLTENQGLFEEAEPLYIEASNMAKKVLGKNHPTYYSLRNNLGMLYESQGVFPKALQTYSAALSAASSNLGNDHPTSLAISNNLGYLYLVTGEYPKAQERFERVYGIWKETLGEEHQRTLKAKNNLARVYAYQDQLDLAEPLFIAALRDREKVLGLNHPDAVRSRIDYASLKLQRGDRDGAMELVNKALDSAALTLGDAHPYTFEALNLKAKIQEAQKDPQGAIATLQEVFKRRNEFYNRVLWAAGENTRAGYIELHKQELYNLYRLLAAHPSQEHALLALQASLDRKGLLLKISSAITKVQSMTDQPELRQIALKLQAKKRRLAKKTLAGSEGQDPAAFKLSMGKLVNDINELERELGAKSAPFARKQVQVSADQLLNSLNADEALIDYVYYEDQDEPRMMALVVSKEKSNCIGFFTCWRPTARMVDLGPVDKLRAAVNFLREMIQDEYAAREDMELAATDAYAAIYSPLKQYVANKPALYVVPEDALYLLPYDAMIDEDGKFLIESQGIRILSSARDLVLESPAPPSQELMIMAGPDYFVENLTDVPQAHSGRRSALAVSAKGLRSLSFDPLDGAEAEGQLIEKMYPRKTEMFIKKAAEEQVLHRLQGPAPRYLHIATHGFFLKPEERLKKRLTSMQRGGNLSTPPPGDNPLFRAGLAFAGVNANASFLGLIDGDNDGVLTAQEVLSLELYGTELVVLSACETGVGEIQAGEGVYGLRRSFQESGVSSVVNSLWPVSDEGTQNLMTDFYGNLRKGENARQSLRDAKLALLAQEQWSHPYFWSAFVMVGPRDR
ncbi:MAG: CHAT domain-containing protein [bacterium]|nr:CHAT domain-containing protein [bacterium]